MKRVVTFVLAMVFTLVGCTHISDVRSEHESVAHVEKEESITKPNPVDVVQDCEPAPAELIPEPSSIKLTIVGDCMLASDFGSGRFQSMADSCDPSYFFDGVIEYFKDDDYTIINLENVITDNDELQPRDKGDGVAYWYKAPSTNLNICTSSSVEVVNLANNHTYDYGSAGAQDTIDAVKAYGMEYGNNDRTVYLEKDGFTIALICHGLWYEGQVQEIFTRLEEAEEKSDFQIVYYHGGTERVHQPEEWRVRSSRALVEAGADLVIGNHPHVLQPMEEYNGALIIYSMGNFIIGGQKYPENRTILLTYTIELLDGVLVNTNYSIVPCYVYTDDINTFQPFPIEEEEVAVKVLDFMNNKEDSPV